jgi:putative inorganic carbon (hco3(-)) transporter
MNAGRAATGLIGAILLGGIGAAGILASGTIQKTWAYVVLGAVSIILGAFLSGNVRLFCFWGLLLTYPFDLGKRFRIIEHLGGEFAYRIEVSDVFLVPLLVLVVRDIVVERAARARIPRAAWIWIAIMVMGLVMMAIGPYRTTISHEVFRMGKVLLLFLVVCNYVVREKLMHHAVMALLVGVILQSLVALTQYVTGMKLGLQIFGEAAEASTESLRGSSIVGEQVYRVGGFLGHPNLLSIYLAMILPIAIGLLFARAPLLLKITAVVAMALGETALIATLSRSGWISFAVALVSVLLLTFVHRRMRHRHIAGRVAILGLSGIIGIAFSGPIVDRITRSHSGATDVRWEWMGDAWRMVQAKPVFGFGLNTYVFEMAPYTIYGGPRALAERFGSMPPAVHNMYLLWWAETGTVGLLMHLAVIISVLVIAWKNLRVQNDVLFAINIGAASGIFAVLIDGLASFSLRINAILRVFWILSGLILAIYYWNRRQQSAALPPPAPATSG